MTEYMIHNTLDREFQKMLYPLHLMQNILFQPKYRILHGFVTPNGYLAHLHCLLGVFVVLAVNVCKYWAKIHDPSCKQTAFQSSVYIFDSVFYTAYSVIICAVNVAQSKNNVQLALKVQRVHRLLDCGAELDRHRVYNWVSVALALILCIMFVSLNYVHDPSDYSQVLFVLTLFYFDANVITALQVMWLLGSVARRWLRELCRFRRACSRTDHTELIKYFREVDLHEFKLYQAYLDILDAFKLYSSIFQCSILLLAIEIFVHPLMLMQWFLEVMKDIDQDVSILERVTPSLWVVKNFALLVAVSVASEQFQLALAAVDAESAATRGRPGGLEKIQKLCKKVWRLNAVRRATRGAGGALAAGAALPLRVLALLATYTVVLLQFAFL